MVTSLLPTCLEQQNNTNSDAPTVMEEDIWIGFNHTATDTYTRLSALPH